MEELGSEHPDWSTMTSRKADLIIGIADQILQIIPKIGGAAMKDQILTTGTMKRRDLQVQKQHPSAEKICCDSKLPLYFLATWYLNRHKMQN